MGIKYKDRKKRLLQPGQSLRDFANGYLYFGFHKVSGGWVYREWAPDAKALYLMGDFNRWDRRSHPMTQKGNGVFEIFLAGENTLFPGCRVLEWDGQGEDRVPLYARRVTQDPESFCWNGEICDPTPYAWKTKNFKPQKDLFIYECHIGMAQELGKVGTYEEFRVNILPRVRDLGYTTIQLMGILEHPYYASFGYQVTNFFAPSSRFGKPEDFKRLVDTAHRMGIAVLLDMVHSHASQNTREGIGCLKEAFFLPGTHPAWGTKRFDYGKKEVLHFLLSNLKYWLEEYHLDGFRFDGVTSMLYWDHGLGRDFSEDAHYFSENTNWDGIFYLQLATALVRELKPDAILIAEEMSAMPGLCRPVTEGGLGFTHRLAMGEPELWISLLRQPEEAWDLDKIYFELSNRRPGEKVIGYCESHDQALVGDKTLMFRMCDADMYKHMEAQDPRDRIYRGMALHKLLRLLTASLGGEGYLTFMGNEFGHPEWIDFPREGNGWSYHYCRRQWSLADAPNLKYQFLLAFEKAMVKLLRKHRVHRTKDRQLILDNARKILVYQRGNLVFAFNLHPTESWENVAVSMPESGVYQVVMSTDDRAFGGEGRIWRQTYEAREDKIQIYLPSRTAVILKKKV